MESWNYGYGDIGESFGENRVVPFLRIAIVTAAKTLKLDDIARARNNVYLRLRTHVNACIHTHTYARELMFPILLFQRSDWSDLMISRDPIGGK